MSKLINPTRKAQRAPFTKLLASIPGLDLELADAANDLVHACTETGKSGSITLTLKLKPLSGKASQIEIESDVKVKEPAMPRAKNLMFATPDNNLQREDPRQQTLDGLRTTAQEEDAQAAVIKAVAAAAPADATHLRVVGAQ